MNNYQSMELHSGAGITEYGTVKGGVPILFSPTSDRSSYGFNFNNKTRESAVDGGLISFIDSSIEEYKYKDIYDGQYGEPIELDNSYLDLISNTKKWEVLLDLNLQATVTGPNPDQSTGNSCTGTVKGCFDALKLYGFSSSSGVNIDDTFLGKRDVSDRVSQLGTFCVRSLTYPSGQIEEIEDIPFNSFIFPDINMIVEGYSFFEFVDGKNKVIYPSPMVKNRTTEKAGDYNANITLKPELAGGLSLEIFIPHIVVTPNKIHAWVSVEGLFSIDYGSFTPSAVWISKKPKPAAMDLAGLGLGPDLPTLVIGEANIKVFQKDVKIILSSYYAISGGLHYTFDVKIDGTSFDITKKEDFPT